MEFEILKLKILRGKRLSVTVKITNHTDAVQHLTLDMARGGGTYNYTSLITDENSNEFKIISTIGISGINRINWIPQAYDVGKSYTTTLNFNSLYDTEKSPSLLGKNFSFSSDFFFLKKDDSGKALRRDGRYLVPESQFNALISDIKP